MKCDRCGIQNAYLTSNSGNFCRACAINVISQALRDSEETKKDKTLRDRLADIIDMSQYRKNKESSRGFIPSMWEYKYSSDHKCPHCGSLHCAIYQDDPDREHTSADVSECDRCGENYLTDEGTSHVTYPETRLQPQEGIRICPSCESDSDEEGQYDPEINGWPR